MNSLLSLNLFCLIRNYSSEEKSFVKSIKNIFGFIPGNIFLYKQAFRHKSSITDKDKSKYLSNERLEFLGDTVLSTVIGEYLTRRFPYEGEGFLTEVRSRLVSRSHLNKLSKKLRLADFIVSSKDVSLNQNALGNAFEAFIGALFLDKGYKFTKKIICKRIIKFYIDIDEIVEQDLNFKSKLIEWGQKEKKEIQFKVINVDNSKRKLYTVAAFIDEHAKGEGQGFAIKEAEQNAAEKVCIDLGI